MFGFLTFGTTLAFADLAIKEKIEAQEASEFPKDLPGLEGKIRLYKNHNPGFAFGFLKERPEAVELVPLCITSGIAGMWLYLMGCRGKIGEKLALTLSLAGGASNLYDRLKRGYVVDYFSIQWKLLQKVVLNLGDLFITAGFVILMGTELAGGLADAVKALGKKK